ncbi:hypothetical protein PPYR_05108 [Photinus pyralis]|uniref:Major facilitator superfamily (MFS) profile domain-containing protein n=1 Tax=Photinus pyralis TaxID=7054 RepID=A0A1Y1MG92_PHOPY|nr:monocarboxylate transporter 10 isoform X2 [Photinus pyralis]KAB0802922.1 hypothetical protein PPYR_05108 [Photinus pyralis]
MDDVQSTLIDNNLNVKSMQNGVKSPKKLIENSDRSQVIPPDGGARAWMVVICSFCCNGILFGIINSSGVFHREFSTYLESINDTAASRKAALVESLSMGTVFVMSPVAGVLTDSIGLRTTTFLGGAIASGGMLVSSFCDYNVDALNFTFGVMYGFGGALAYTPSLAILGHYFKKRLGIVNGIVTSGSSTFTIVMSYLIDWLLKNVKIAWTFRILALLVAVIMGCAVVFKPLNFVEKKDAKTMCKTAFNVSIWKNKKYVIWALLIPFSLFGYFVVYVHMPKFVEVVISKDADGKLPVTCIGITSLFGRLIFGYLADLPKVNRIYLQQLALFVMGVMTMLMPACDTFGLLLATTLCLGLFDGCFISMVGPVAFKLCGQDGATQAIGFILGLCSVPLTLGPYLAGALYDKTGSYVTAFVCAGIPPIIGSIALFAIKFVKSPATVADAAEQPLQKHKHLNGDILNDSLSYNKKDEYLNSSDAVGQRCEGGPNVTNRI